MQRFPAWLPLIVAASVAAGILAFLSATPDQSTRVQPDQLGFTKLTDDYVDAALAAAAAHHRARNRAAVRERAAGTTTQRWLESLAGDRTQVRRGIGIAGETPEARARISALQTWSDGIAPATWRIVVLDVGSVAEAGDAWAVEAAIHVRLTQAETRTRALRMPVVVQVAAPVREGAPWRVRDVRVDAPRTRVRAYLDPVVLRAGTVDVVAPAAREADARAVVATASTRLPALRKRYGALPGADTATIWMVQGVPARRAVLGRAEAADPTHPIAGMTSDGDVVVDLTAWRAADSHDRNAAITHALVHVALRGALEDAPQVLVEAVARAEAGDATDAVAEHASTTSTGELEALLRASATTTLDADDRVLAHAFGSWLLDVHGGSVAADLLARIQLGLDVDRAVRRVLGATPGGVDARVREWATQRLAPPAGDDRDVRGDEQATDDDTDAVGGDEPAEEGTPES